MQVLYCLSIFRDYINQLRSPVEGVAIKIRTFFKEIETSSVLVRTCVYVKYLNLQRDESGMQCDAHECLLQLLEKIYIDGCQKIIRSTKAVYVTQLSVALII